MKSDSRHLLQIASLLALAAIVACADQRGFRAHKTTMEEVLEGEAIKARAEGRSLKRLEAAEARGLPVEGSDKGQSGKDANAQASGAGGSDGKHTATVSDEAKKKETEAEKLAQALKDSLKEEAARAVEGAVMGAPTPKEADAARAGAARSKEIVPGALQATGQAGGMSGQSAQQARKGSGQSAAAAGQVQLPPETHQTLVEIVESLNSESSQKAVRAMSVTVDAPRMAGQEVSQHVRLGLDFEVNLTGGKILVSSAKNLAIDHWARKDFRPEAMQVQKIMSLDSGATDLTSRYGNFVKILVAAQRSDGQKNTDLQIWVSLLGENNKVISLVAHYLVSEDLSKVEFVASTAGELSAIGQFSETLKGVDHHVATQGAVTGGTTTAERLNSNGSVFDSAGSQTSFANMSAAPTLNLKEPEASAAASSADGLKLPAGSLVDQIPVPDAATEAKKAEPTATTKVKNEKTGLRQTIENAPALKDGWSGTFNLIDAAQKLVK